MIDVYVSGSSIDLGRQGENEARNIYFDLSDLRSVYGDGNATLVHMRPSDQAPYICETSVIDTYLAWTPSSTDTAYSGSGKCELRWVVGETLAKSIIYTTTIAPSITGAGEVPSPYKSWYDAIIAYIEANYAANGAPQEVREAIYTLLSKAAYTETGLTDELAIVQAWTAETISVTNNLTHVTNSNTATMAEQGGSYTGTLTADSGYILGTVTVTMGGSDITATVYSSGTITIPSVTGDIVITATAVAAVSSLSAVYTQSGNVYDDFTLDDLTSNLVVTATYSDSSTVVIPSSSYTLSGTLEAGTTSTITVSYGGKTATFNVSVSTPLYAFTTGAHNFTSPAGTVQTTSANEAKIIMSTANGNDIHANLSNASANGTACNSRANYLNNSTTFFTVPAGSTVTFKMIVTEVANPTDTAKATAYIVASGSTSSATNAIIALDSSFFVKDAQVGDEFTASKTIDAATDALCIGMWIGGRNSRAAVTLGMKYIIYVDDVRYI